jgi:multiple sugar transport system ATP-binding protein
VADIVIDKIAKSFGTVRALHEMSLTIADGEFVALLGPSGCGKTTLLRIIAGLEKETGGRILIAGREVNDLPPRERGLAMVFQNYAVFPHMTVRDNIAFGLAMQNKPADVIKRQVDKAAGLLHIEPYLDRYPGKLSGGQRQRVAVARALAVEPPVLLMDEPLSNLDALLRLEMRTELKAVLREAKTTTIYVTHDQTEAMGLADRIAVMHGGRIEQIGTPTEIYARPATQFVGGFIGSPPMNFLRLDATNGTVALGSLKLKAAVMNGPIVLGLRGEDVALAPAGAHSAAMRVQVVEPMGSHLLVTGTIAGQRVRIVLPPQADVKPMSDIGLSLDETRVTWIDETTGKALR